jgi:hypothetical protein
MNRVCLFCLCLFISVHHGFLIFFVTGRISYTKIEPDNHGSEHKCQFGVYYSFKNKDKDVDRENKN